MNKTPSLALCILMDFIGYTSYSIPLLGEFSDIVWAPISAIVFYITFGGKKAIFGSLFNFAEEILPFTDFIPTFTIAWIWRKVSENKVQQKVVGSWPGIKI